MIRVQEFLKAPSKAMADSAHKQKAKTEMPKTHLLAMSPEGDIFRWLFLLPSPKTRLLCTVESWSKDDARDG